MQIFGHWRPGLWRMDDCTQFAGALFLPGKCDCCEMKRTPANVNFLIQSTSYSQRICRSAAEIAVESWDFCFAISARRQPPRRRGNVGTAIRLGPVCNAIVAGHCFTSSAAWRIAPFSSFAANTKATATNAGRWMTTSDSCSRNRRGTPLAPSASVPSIR